MDKFSIVFDKDCNLWIDDMVFNYYVCNNYLLNKYVKGLELNGYVLLIDIYRELGIKPFADMLTMGWHRNSGVNISFKLITNHDESSITIEFIGLEDLRTYF